MSLVNGIGKTEDLNKIIASSNSTFKINLKSVKDAHVTLLGENRGEAPSHQEVNAFV